MSAEVSLTRWLGELTSHLPSAIEGKDPEGLHRVRVAAKRLSVWLSISGWKLLQSDLKWLRSAASEVRELDLLLLEAHPNPWLSWLRGRRLNARKKLLACYRSPRLAGLTQALAELPPLPGKRALKALEAMRRRVLRLGNRVEGAKSTPEDIHRLRRAVREVRYTVEWMDGDPGALLELQDALGSFNDASAALHWFEAFPKAETLPDERHRLETRMAQRSQEALACWKANRGVFETPFLPKQ